MLTATILATTLYITPVYKSGGQFGTFGMKFTQKVSDGIFFKIRVFNKPIQNKDDVYTIKTYMEFDF